MSTNKMLIDATHPEETRVVVLRNGRVEEFDYESAARKLLRGNIYLAKVTRVEPSLQAAFVDYGGNRHGFLAFSEIHPDYYQIPVADRELLKQQEAEAEAEAEAIAEERAERRARQQEERRARSKKAADARAAEKAGMTPGSTVLDAAPVDENADTAEDAATAAVARAVAASAAGSDVKTGETDQPDGDSPDAPASEEQAAGAPAAIGLVEDQGVLDEGSNDTPGDSTDGADVSGEGAASEDDRDDSDDDSDDDDDDDDSNGSDSDPVEEVGSEDAMEEVAERPRRRARQYKIQEVIKRRQVLLVQVVKEERGNKGAALTTYLSLAGRYTVLMPNTGRGGGISRKITTAQDRKRLKSIANELDVPEGMGLIIRTAGASRTKAEIQRDFEYLLRLWESVRELTLESSAPDLVYEEGNLIKRSIRDLYTKEIDEILVSGKESHEEAQEFMGMLMPSHAKHVISYEQPEPLFAKYQIERQLNAMFSPYVTLKSGGYIVINQTEALVSVDVNSGKSTREFSIEQTALNTNLEAAEELGRQLKLRDLAGLIVIDFIDMEERRNNRSVERRIKECLKNDRARIQVGRISHFGLLEMSRQRMRTGVLEGSTTQCPHCAGTGTIRSTESVALAVLRALEDALIGNSRNSLTAVTTATVGLYILNYKRPFINEMEERYGVAITIEASDRMQGANFSIEKSTVQAPQQQRSQTGAVNMESGFETAREVVAAGGDDESDSSGAKKPRRRRRGGRKTRNDGEQRADNAAPDDTDASDAAGSDASDSVDEQRAGGSETAGGDDQDKPRRARRRGRRGGRRNRERGDTGQQNNGQQQAGAAENGDTQQQAPSSGNGGTMIPGRGEQPDLGDLPGLHGAAPRVAQPKGSPADAGAEAGDSNAGSREAGESGETGAKSSRGRSRGRRQPRSRAPAAAETGAPETAATTGTTSASDSSKPAPEPAREPAREPETVAATTAAKPEPAAAKSERKGWWQRAFSGD